MHFATRRGAAALPCQHPTTSRRCFSTVVVAARDDTVWHVKALELYPEGTVTLGEFYPTYQALVRDDNRQQAALLLDLATVSCREKAQQGPTAAECVVLALEWCRGAKRQTFRCVA